MDIAAICLLIGVLSFETISEFVGNQKPQPNGQRATNQGQFSPQGQKYDYPSQQQQQQPYFQGQPKQQPYSQVQPQQQPYSQGQSQQPQPTHVQLQHHEHQQPPYPSGPQGNYPQFQQPQTLNPVQTPVQQPERQQLPPSKLPPRLPYQIEPPRFPNQPNQQGQHPGGYRHPSFAELASMKSPPNDTITRAAVNIQDAVPSAQMKYDVDENPVVTFGHDGFEPGLGDRAATVGEFPYNAQLRHSDKLFCGATLIKSPISGRHVIITTAHCIVEPESIRLDDPRTIEIRMGVRGLNEEGQSRGIKAWWVHSDFVMLRKGRRPLFNDIGLIIPDREFEENKLVGTIELPTIPGPTLMDKICVRGWGVRREAGNTGVASVLRKIDLPLWDNADCDNVFFNESGKHIIRESHFCAGYTEGGKDTCNGDSGASATASYRAMPYLAGMVSWGLACGKRGYPGVYVRVWSYMDWIRETLYEYEKFGKVPAPTRPENYI